MTRTEQIIARVRHSLGDTAKTRWSDEQLLTLLSEGQQDMSIRCLLLKKEVSLDLLEGEDIYTLPSDFIKLEAAWASMDDSNRSALTLVSYKDFYANYRGQAVSGQPTHIITGLTDRLQVMLWPIPSALTQKNVFESDELTGIIAEGDNLIFDKPYGLIANMDLEGDIVCNSPYGIITDIVEVVSTLTIVYYYKPEPLKSMQDELTISDTCDAGLRYYVTGMALRDDMDTRNRAAATEELLLYDNEVKRNAQDRATSFTQNSKDVLQTKFRTGFEI